MRTERLAKMGLLLALGMILSYVEALFPIAPSMPGVKIRLEVWSSLSVFQNFFDDNVVRESVQLPLFPGGSCAFHGSHDGA